MEKNTKLKKLKVENLKPINTAEVIKEGEEIKKQKMIENDDSVMGQAYKGLNGVLDHINDVVAFAKADKEDKALEAEFMDEDDFEEDETVEQTYVFNSVPEPKKKIKIMESKVEEEEVEEEEVEEEEVEEEEAEKIIKETPTKKIKVKEDVESNKEDEFEDDEDDFDDDEDDFDDDEDDVTTNDNLKIIKKDIEDKVKPVKNKIDLNTFKISKKQVSISNALKRAGVKQTIMDWGLYTSEKAISIKEFTAADLSSLSMYAGNRNRLNKFTDIYNLIFDHIVDNNKFSSMEEWVKNVPYYDIPHLYFAIYKASFEGTNHVPYDCPHCKKSFIRDNVDINEMIKYKNKKIKKKFETIVESDSTSDFKETEVTLVQISDEYVLGVKVPSIYNISFETSLMSEKTINKHRALIELMSFIDSIYVIDGENNELLEIETKIYPNNISKTLQSKVSRYSKILSSLNSDQLLELEAIMDKMDVNSDDLYYIIPECTCRHCSKTIEEKAINPEILLFTRHQLVRIANS